MMQKDFASPFLFDDQQEQQPCLEISANIYLSSLLKHVDSLYTLHQICHADRLFNRRRQYVKSELLIEMADENEIGNLARIFQKSTPYVDDEILTFFIFKIERRRQLIYAVSRHLNISPINKSQFDQIANEIYVFGM